MSKVKEKILKASREKGLITRELSPLPHPSKPITDFSIEMLQARRKWQNIFKVLKGKNLKPRILYPARLSFRIEGEIAKFSGKQKLKEYSNTKTILKEILRDL